MLKFLAYFKYLHLIAISYIFILGLCFQFTYTLQTLLQPEYSIPHIFLLIISDNCQRVSMLLSHIMFKTSQIFKDYLCIFVDCLIYDFSLLFPHIISDLHMFTGTFLAGFQDQMWLHWSFLLSLNFVFLHYTGDTLLHLWKLHSPRFWEIRSCTSTNLSLHIFSLFA